MLSAMKIYFIFLRRKILLGGKYYVRNRSLLGLGNVLQIYIYLLIIEIIIFIDAKR